MAPDSDALDDASVPFDPSGLRFDMAHDLLCTADEAGRFTSLNAAWESVLGWSREELMARPFVEFLHPEDVELTLAAHARISETDFELIGFENRYGTKDGGWRWLRWNARTDGATWFAIASDVTERRLGEERLRKAIAEEGLVAYSQPIIDQRTGGVVQEELLARLLVNGDEPGRVLTPAEFLPAAERSGLIRTIDRWMTMRGLELAERGRNVEVNLSALTIADEALMGDLIDHVDAAGVSARRLVFEITETAAIENVDAARELAERLGRLGCAIALDDFGTGYGSLTHLRQLPVKLIKIDASFVRGLREHYADRAVVRGVAAIARELEIQTVAEGVEDGTTFSLLRKFGVDRFQGFLIGRPAPLAT